MLTKLYIDNFKSIKMDEPIDLNNFSILCGSNSSGKSSLIQAILLVCQSFSNGYQNKSIALNGNLVRLGAFQDIKNHFSENESLILSLTIPIKNCLFRGGESKVFKFEFEMGLDKDMMRGDEYHPLILSNKVSINIKDDDGRLIETDYIEVKYSNQRDKSWPYHVVDFRSSELNRIELEYPDYEILGGFYGELIPQSLALKFDYIKK
ncbi:AAA family ATPase [Citrobacter freundii]|nr:AAA family ATPase [Citrobacter freundii]